MNIRSIFFASVASLALSACATTNVTPPVPGHLQLGAPVTFAKAAYVDAFASGALAQITASGWQSPNILVIAFADPTTAASNSTIAAALTTAASNRSAATSGNQTFLSIGGAVVVPASWPQPPATLAANIAAQINAYNASLSGNNQVVGVDLDLENGFTAASVNSIAQAMKAVVLSNGKTLLVSIAPQVVGVTGVNVDATNPTNLGFSAGGINNNFGLALKNGFVDDVLAQTYNTGPTGIVLNNVTNTQGQVVSGVDESKVLFAQGIAQAINGTVQASCAAAINLCIPSTTRIFVGEPVNQGAGGTYTIFNPTAPAAPPIQYDQAAILNSLASELNYMFSSSPSLYSHINGVVTWQLGNDYAPNLYGDTFATKGLFSTKIFGAAAPPAGPNILLQLTNNGTGGSETTTLITSAQQYYPFPAVNASSFTSWCTLAASGSSCPDSFILDTIGAGTFTVQVTPSTGVAWLCPANSGGIGSGSTITLTSGFHYNLQVNSDYKSCAFGTIP
jgi:chitinase